METVAAVVVPPDTMAGSGPNLSSTDSPSSLTASSTAVTTKLFSVSPASNVRPAGTPE